MGDRGAGRFAPSPTSDLHLGNLRTALLAWLFARSTGRAYLVRIEDLDTGRVAAAGDAERRQLDDLAALGLGGDGPVVRQSGRLGLYADAVATLDTYECFCTRAEIRQAASAPHSDGYRPYPGTCRSLPASERARRRGRRPPALRVHAGGASMTVRDRWAGDVAGEVDDFVVRRNDGAYAYNLAVVVDDIAQGVDQVVRGDDLLTSSPRQAWLTERLGGSVPEYAHVPLVLNPDGRRLAKRDGAVTLGDLAARGLTPPRVLAVIGESLRLCGATEDVTPERLLGRFDPGALPRDPWIYPP